MKIVGLLLITLAVANAGVLCTRTVAPQGWRKSREASVQERVNFQLALRQQNLDQLEKIFHEVSDPSHPNYQNFLTPAQIQALVSPPAEEHQRVVDWLLQSGVKAENIKSFGDSIKASTTVMLAARMFSTSFFQYIHEDGRRLIAAHGDYSVPSHLEGLITMVTGLSHFPIPHLKWHKYDRTANPTPNADYGIIPQTLTGLYNIRPVVPGSALNTSQGVIEFEEQNFSPTDLDNYGKDLGIKIPPVSDEHTVGPNDPSAPSTEGQLDIEVIAGVNPESDNWFWFNSPSDKWLFEWITEFNAAADVPYIISVSYAWWEGDQCNPGISGDACSQMGVDSYGYARAVNTEFMKSGTRGITIFVASGDSGTNGRTDPSCTIPKLRPDFPACSPYVTSVGATELINAQPIPNAPAICKTFGGCAKSGTEQAVSYRISNYASGGGFSNTGAQPSWQKAAVSAYLSGGTTLPPASYYNASGRGFPDIAALGHQCVVVQYGQTEGVGGTSCAAPFVAGIFGLLNQYSFQKTGKPLGFVNPLIYQMFAADPTIFQDITVGDNKCTEDGCSPSCKGFLAAKGWDPVTGVGTPNFAKILKYLQAQVFADK